MCRFEDYNPIAIFVFFAGITLPAMFCMDPILLGIGMVGASAFYLTLKGTEQLKQVLWIFAMPLIGAVACPVFSHNGATVLIVVNDTPITLEAVWYGAVMGLMLGTVLLWFRCFSIIMTSDKLLYIMGAASPKLALILSMTLRYIPLYRRQVKKISQTQKALGMYKEDVFLEKLRGSLRIFSVMVTWALENGVVTADSMTARGYGVGRRTQFAVFRWRKGDVILLLVTLLLCGTVIGGIGGDALGYTFYPYTVPSASSALRTLSYIAAGLASLLPAVMNIREVLLWRSLQSEI